MEDIEYKKFDHFDSLFFSLKNGIINIGLSYDDIYNMTCKLKKVLREKNSYYVKHFNNGIYIDKRVNMTELKSMLEDTIYSLDIKEEQKDKLVLLTHYIKTN